MSLVTPGVAFLCRGVAYLSVYVGSTYYGASQLAIYYGVEIPNWVIITGALIAAPVLGRLYVSLRDFKHKRRAAALGARVVPRIVGAKIGNLDVVERAMNNSEKGYVGEDMQDPLTTLGPTFNLNIMYSDLIFTTSPEHVKLILATDFQNFVKGERFGESMRSVLGTGVFNSDGEMWKFHRSLTRPVFARDRIADFDIFDRHADQVLAVLKQRLREGHAVDFQDLMGRFTIDTATEFLFGTCVHTLSAGLPYPPNATYLPNGLKSSQKNAADEFADAFLKAQEIIANRERLSWIWPLFEINKDKTADSMKIVNAYIEPVIKEAVERKRNSPPQDKNVDDKEAEKEGCLLDHLLDVTTDPVVLRDETLNIMIAGRDTTAATLTFVIYLLSQHPDVLQRLRAEILEKVGPNRRPNFEDLKDLKYLRAVLNETLRLFPIVPFNVRQSVNEAIWPSPIPSEKPLYIPPKTSVVYSVFLMHRRKDLWGPDAEEFDPDRFLDDRLKKYLLKNSFVFLPFNAGPRICLGQQYAYNEMSFMVIRLLQSFSDISLDLASAPKEAVPPADWAKGTGRKAIEKVRPKNHLTMYASGGVWVKMTEATN
ncbi:hypothetical protein EST38_g3734 [Candolleomyces aberdarensis]|uniref:Uncharacterized protein n=1 Tax=Candolleomyces aberdarensis TaxID=2316362 RepID=A0A4Q2DTB6_9AGAR|nr:hypothetical protein EST38_g3734 [Candolleomyces aberdarensis]